MNIQYVLFPYADKHARWRTDVPNLTLITETMQLQVVACLFVSA